MLSGANERLICLIQLVVLFLVVLGAIQTVRAQTPGLNNLTLTSTTGANSIDDAIVCTYTLTGSATTAATAWYRDGQPVMTLYMPFEGGAAGALQDLSGRGVTSSAIGTTVWSATAGRGGSGAFQFSGTNYINSGNSFPAGSSYTTAAWVYPTDLSVTLIPLGSSASSSAGHALRLTRDGRVTAGHNGNWKIVQSGTGEIVVNTWYFLTVTYDATSGTMTLYKNGKPLDTAKVASGEAVVSDATVQIGALQGTANFRGTLDDIRIYNSVLSPEQIALLYTTSGQNQISSKENHVDDVWEAQVTPFSSSATGSLSISNNITIVPTAPLIITLAIVAGIEGKKYAYDVDATGGPKPTFSLLNGPPGMGIDAITGLVTWVPLTAGAYSVSVSATNTQGIDIQSYTLVVASPTVGIANLQLAKLPGGDVQSSNDLTLSAITSATAWLKNGQPLMTLFMPFEGGPKYALEDYSGHNLVTIPMGNPVWLATGGRDGHGAYQFDGNSYLYAGDIFPLHSSYTKAAWIYHTVGGEFHHIISGWDHNISGTQGHGLRVSYDNRLSAGQNGDWRIVQSNANAIALNRWYFAAVTFNYATSEMILYLDGVPVDTTIVAANLRDVTDPCLLVGATQGSFAWKGKIDDVRVYNYALAPQQIQALFAAGGGNRVVSLETQNGQTWQSQVTTFSNTEASVPFASNIITIGVSNQPPVLAAIGPRTIAEAQTLSFNVSATDPDATVPTLSAAPLPANATFVDNSNGTGAFSFTPSFSQAGTYNVRFIAADGQAADSEMVTITVTNVNRPPVLAAIGNQKVAEGSVLTLVVSASDPDVEALTLAASGLPQNAVFVDSANGRGGFTFAPSYLQAGIYYVWFRVFDPSLAGDSALVQITVTDTPQNALWLATLHVQGETAGAAVTQGDVQIGVQSAAQLSPASPAPPEYTTLLHLRDAANGGPYFRDVRKIGDQCYYWVIELDPHGNVAPPTPARCAVLSWDPAGFSPDNHYVLRQGFDPAGPIVVADMRTTTQFQVCDVQTSKYFTVHWESDACAGTSYATIPLSAGWNLISLPVIPASQTLADIVPSAEIAFEFNGSYHEITSLQPCLGYWVKVPSSTTVVLSGAAVTDCPMTLADGWHLVGSPACVATLQTTPDGALQAMFGFNGSYSPAAQTVPGGGFWAKVSPGCSVNSVCASPAPLRSPAVNASGSSGSRLVIKAEREATGLVGSAVVELGADVEPSVLVSPPDAPECAVEMNLYRAGWSGPYYRDVRSTDATDNIWILSVNPVGNESAGGIGTATLSWDPATLGDDRYELHQGFDTSGAVVVADMRAVTSYAVAGDNRSQYFAIVRIPAMTAAAVPDQYELSQNYPNPFNPTTVIEYTLPERSQVSLTIYNVLGQEVRTLVNDIRAAGSYRIEWNGADDSGKPVATGVYLYRLQAGDFTQTRKMLLMK